MAHFVPPAIEDNPRGWGPNSIPSEFKDMPYQPFAKGDRLGKVKHAFIFNHGEITDGPRYLS